MRKKNVILVLIFIVVAAFAFFGIYHLVGDQNKPMTDALKFKEEYESLNNTIRQSDGEVYNEVKISKNNPVKYIDAKEAIEILDSKQAIIYVGAAWCPWCRNAVPVLIELAEKYDIDEIYYLNLDTEKSTYEVENGELKNTVKGSEDYYKLLEKLSDRLSDYKITDENGIEYDTHEKRIYIPYVIAVKNGKIVGDHVGTVDLDDGQSKYDPLTSEQYDDLYAVYEEMFKQVYKYKDTTCNDAVCY